MPAPTLSVVTPTYNRARSLEAAVVAVCTQSRPPDEYVILDDGSTDETPALLAELAARFPMIRVLRNPRPSGAGPAAHQVVAAATGTFVYGAASDDVVVPGALAALMGLAEVYPHAGIVCGQIVQHAADGVGQTLQPSRWSVPLYADPETFLREYLQVEKPGFSLCGATCYHREALAALGGMPGELGHFCDTYAARTLGLAHGVAYVPTPVVVWNIDDDSASQAAARDPRGMLDIAARAEHLMRKQHAHLYPDAFVREWTRRYREQIVTQALEAFRGSLDRLLAAREASLPLADEAVTGGLRARALSALEACWRRYPGDLSCYAEA